MKIAVDRERCVGSGQCLLRLPDVFGQDDDEGLVVLLEQHGAGHDADAVNEVAYGCPSQAIAVDE